MCVTGLIQGLESAEPKTVIAVTSAFIFVVLTWIILKRLAELQKKPQFQDQMKHVRSFVMALILFTVVLLSPNVIFTDDVLPTTVLVHVPLYMTLHVLWVRRHSFRLSLDASTRLPCVSSLVPLPSNLRKLTPTPPCFCEIYFLCSSLSAQYAMENPDVIGVNHWLCYWSVYAVFDTLWRFPGMSSLLRNTPVLGKLRLFGGVWLGVRRSGGAEMIMAALVPLVSLYFKRIPKSKIAGSSNMVIRVLKLANVVSAERGDELAVALADPGSLIALAGIFLITPEPVTRAACLFVQLVYPVYASMFSYVNDSYALKTKWLRFWLVSRIVLLILDQMRHMTRWIPLWTRFELFFSIWLQLPYFNGAQQIYERFARTFNPIWLRIHGQFKHSNDTTTEPSQITPTEVKPKRRASDIVKQSSTKTYSG